MTLLRELIDIPDQVHQGDFVLKLTDGVADPDGTLGQYVVTPQLAAAFDQALGLIGGALAAGNSRASYLHGSFGSGKSHFMAVLDLLLAGTPEARAIPELSEVVARHDGWLSDGKFLLVPLHLIGARSLEDGLFNGYVRHVSRLHPDAPPPAVFTAGPILANADDLRASIGDAAFFDALGKAGGDDGGWGALAAGWDAASYDAARTAPPGDAEQARLIGDLTSTLLSAYAGWASSAGGAYVGIDDGLSALSKHAVGLGYQGLVLFLDELVLWLVSRVADVAFVSEQASKLSKLVESSNPDRPVPIVSFIARQRDLAELVGQHALGNELTALSDQLKFASGRIPPILLEDRNLPVIAERRLLRPRDAAAREAVDAAFAETERSRSQVLDTLLGGDGDRAGFRRTYPFSPAFMETLVAVSGALQRERTALKVMLQLLVDRRDDLELGQVVPVGDLWDVVAAADEPFAPEMKQRFAGAKRLYQHTLRPVLLEAHGLTDDDAAALPRTHAFVSDDRLVKTLLLAALVPEVEPLRSITVDRLAALNHGTFRSPLPGAETQMVMQTVQRLASNTGAVRLGEEPGHPTVSIVITGVDTAGILDQARHVDNTGEQRRLLKSLAEAQLGIKDEGQLRHVHEFWWRGTRRSVEVEFANVRDAADLPDAALQTRGEEWKVVVDFPFDTAGHVPDEDLSRIRSLRNLGMTSNVVCWIPAFFMPAMSRRLGDLVVLEHVLSGDRFGQYAGHLSPTDRASANGQLEGQRSQLRNTIRQAIVQAYGVATADPAVVDTTHTLDQHFPTLRPDLTVRPPIATDLAGAFSGLLDQVFSHAYPAHPAFGRDVRVADLRKVHAEVRKTLDAPGNRIVPERALRPLLAQIANPLRLGHQSEQGFSLDDHWVNHTLRAIGRAEARGAVTVGALRASFDDPTPMGLTRETQDLVLLVVCEKLGYSFTRHGGPYPGAIGDLPDDLEVHKQDLPDPAVWDDARRRLGRILGETVASALTPANVAELAAKAAAVTRALRPGAQALLDALTARAQGFGVTGTAPRLATAAAAAALLDALASASPEEVPGVLAGAVVPLSEEATATSLAKADEVVGALHATNWRIVDGAIAEAGGAEVRERVAAALSVDEIGMSLAGALADVTKVATDLMLQSARERAGTDITGQPAPSGARRTVSVDPGVPTGPSGVGTSGTERAPMPPFAPDDRTITVRGAAGLDATLAQLRDQLDRQLAEQPGVPVVIRWTVEE